MEGDFLKCAEEGTKIPIIEDIPVLCKDPEGYIEEQLFYLEEELKLHSSIADDKEDEYRYLAKVWVERLNNMRNALTSFLLGSTYKNEEANSDEYSTM